jgi:hypothetical protein
MDSSRRRCAFIDFDLRRDIYSPLHFSPYFSNSPSQNFKYSTPKPRIPRISLRRFIARSTTVSTFALRESIPPMRGLTAEM